MALLFCSVCGRPGPTTAAIKNHVRGASDGKHRERSGEPVVVDASGDPVDNSTLRELVACNRSEGELRGRHGHNPVKRREALATYIDERGGSPHVIDHPEQAERFDVSTSVINRDLSILRERGVIEDATGPYECGFCGEIRESIRAVKVHVTKRGDDVHRDHDGSDPGAVNPLANPI